MSMKYIHTHDLGVVIFPASLTHQRVKERLCPPGDVVVGAGFIAGLGDDLQCYGESISLKVKSSPEDTRMLQVFIGI